MALGSPLSADGAQYMDPVRHNLIFEGFLKKRKDTMKFTWAKYWFKLQNTTLYFYTRRDAQQANLRGQYYMYSVQSVRSISSPDGDFPFEIVMKNGKKKLLSAESEDLRDVWLKLLWKSMQLPGPGHTSSSCIWYDIPELIQRGNSSSDWTPRSDGLKTPLESAPQGSSSLTDEYDLLKSSQADDSGSEGDTNSDPLFSSYDGPPSWSPPPTPTAAAPDDSDAALGQDRMKLFFPGGDESDDDSDPEFSIYDVPRSQTPSSNPAAAAPEAAPPASPGLSYGNERSSSPDAALGQDYTTMEKLSLCDSPAPEHEDGGSGVEAQYMLMSDLGGTPASVSLASVSPASVTPASVTPRDWQERSQLGH